MKKTLLLAALALTVLSAPSLALTGSPAEIVAKAAAESAASPLPAEYPREQTALPWLLPTPIPASGCTAEYFCVHGTTVSCSSPTVGTCTSSGQGCGVVVCNGQTTWCPGRCVGDHHCATFCNFSPTASCDPYGCCVC